MTASNLWPRVLLIAGIVGMLIGAIDPLEGSFLVAPSVAVAALGALVGKTRHRALLYWALALVVLGVAALVALSQLGGVGGSTGRSMWWLLVCAPYPIGWLLGLVGAAVGVFETCPCRVPKLGVTPPPPPSSAK